MDNPSSSKRKRYSSSPKRTPSNDGSKKSIHSSNEQSSPSSNHPKLIDQLYQTYWSLKAERVSATQIESSQKEHKSKTYQISKSREAGIKLKQQSLELKSCELKRRKIEFFKSQIEKARDQKFSAEIVNKNWELVNLIYENIKYMLKKEGCFDQHFSNVSEIKTTIIEKQKEKSKKLEIDLIEEENLETQRSVEKCELENLIKKLWNVREEEEKSQDSVEVFTVNDVKQNLDSIERSLKNLNDQEIVFENFLQEKTDQSLKEDSKFSQDQQESEVEFMELETEVKDLSDVDEMRELGNLKIKEIISRKLIPDTDIEKDFIEEIQQIEAKIKKLELKSDVRKASADSSNLLLKLESRLTDSKDAINLILSKNIEVDNLDMSLMEANKKIELFQSEQTSKNNELRSLELGHLIREQEKNNEENAQIIQEGDQILRYEKEESTIRDLETDFAQKEKARNEKLEKYNNMKQVNNEYLAKNPNLLETKCLTAFTAMKKESEAIISSAQERVKTTEKRYETKLKELQHKNKKYLDALKEVEEEFSPKKEHSKDHDFASLRKKIKEAEEKLQKKKTDLQKMALPVIVRSEAVRLDKETLSLRKTLTKKLPEKPTYTLFSDDSSENGQYVFPLSQRKIPSLETDLDKEDAFFPLSQARGLQSFSENYPGRTTEVKYSFPLTQGKNEKSTSQTSFDELKSELEKSQKNDKRIFPSSQLPSSQTSFEYETQKKEKIDISRYQTKLEISTPTKARAIKEAEKGREKRFFKSASQTIGKSYKRSKSVPPRKV